MNSSLSNATTPSDETDRTSHWITIGLPIGAALIVILVIILVACLYLKRRKRDPEDDHTVVTRPKRKGVDRGSLCKTRTIYMEEDGYRCSHVVPLTEESDRLYKLRPKSRFSRDVIAEMQPSKTAHECGHCKTSPETGMKEELSALIKGAIAEFHKIPNRVKGTCYASELFAIGEFGSEGGVLRLVDNDFVKMVIPSGALETTQLIYFMMHFQNNDVGDDSPTLSPKFECGPDGLQFKIPVELTFQHAATDVTDVAVFSRNGKSTRYAEDGSLDGPKITALTPQWVTLSIHHFTGHKLSKLFHSFTERRRPRPNQAQQNGKRLSVSVFTLGDKAKIYFITEAESARLRKQIEAREKKQRFKITEWKLFNFELDRGGLRIRTFRKGNRTETTFSNEFLFDDRLVMSHCEKSVELITDEPDLILDITFDQPEEGTDSTQFCVKLSDSSKAAQIRLTDEEIQRINMELVRSLMTPLRLQAFQQINDRQTDRQTTAINPEVAPIYNSLQKYSEQIELGEKLKTITSECQVESESMLGSSFSPVTPEEERPPPAGCSHQGSGGGNRNTLEDLYLPDEEAASNAICKPENLKDQHQLDGLDRKKARSTRDSDDLSISADLNGVKNKSHGE